MSTEFTGPNFAGHFKCEEELSEQKELFAVFFFFFKYLKHLDNCVVLWGGLKCPSNLIKSVLRPSAVTESLRLVGDWQDLVAGVSIVRESPFSFPLDPQWRC